MSQIAPTTDDLPGLTVSIRQRRKALGQRILLGLAAAMVFAPLIGLELSLAWCAGYLAMQLLDLAVFAPIVSGRLDRLQGWRALVGYPLLMANAGFFGALAIPLWQSGGAIGGICAVMLLTAGCIYSTINAIGSRTVLGLTLSMPVVFLTLTPVLMARQGAPSGYVTATAISVAIFICYCLSTWQRMDKARKSETAARNDAERRRLEAEQIMEGRAAFLATIGHDLRTPISAILSGAAELEKGAVDGAARSQARLISDAGDMMRGLLDDLLDHAKLETGHMRIEATDFDLRDLMAQTYRLWQAPVRAKGLRLRLEGARRLPTVVHGDALRLRQILNNLISNAIKFTSEGSITLAMMAWSETDDAHQILIEVRDTGRGMTREQLTRLFTPFDQTEDGVSATYGGTGLGLAISRQLATLMGGRVTARAQPGEGSAFTLSLCLPQGDPNKVQKPTVAVRPAPLVVTPGLPTTAASDPGESSPPLSAAALLEALGGEAPQDQATTAVEIKPSPSAPEPVPPAPEPGGEVSEGDRKLRVLVVDDHDINRRALQLILEPLGCDVALAVDGMAALGQCEGSAFDLIFMDVRMPELDGRETTRRLRAGSGPNAETPVIAVTADTQPEDIAACNAAGMTYFVPKPITPAMLIQAMETVLASPDEDRRSDAA